MKKLKILMPLIVLGAFLLSGCASMLMPQKSSDEMKSYEGSVFKILLPQGTSIGEENSSHNKDVEVVYINVPQDGAFITLTASTVPYQGMKWDEGKEMYKQYLLGKSAQIIDESEMKNSKYPNAVFKTEEQAESQGGTLTVYADNIVFLVKDKLCAIVGVSAEQKDFESIQTMCADIFKSFELL